MCSMQYNIQGQKLDPRCGINKHIVVFTYLLLMCINFPITVRVLQNNERGFSLIFATTEVGY
jgi:hypothetical protein